MSSAGCDCMAELRMWGDLAELDRFCKRPKSHTVASPHPASYSEFQATNSGSAMPDARSPKCFTVWGIRIRTKTKTATFPDYVVPGCVRPFSPTNNDTGLRAAFCPEIARDRALKLFVSLICLQPRLRVKHYKRAWVSREPLAWIFRLRWRGKVTRNGLASI
jgi:hypothetical protein